MKKICLLILRLLMLINMIVLFLSILNVLVLLSSNASQSELITTLEINLLISSVIIFICFITDTVVSKILHVDLTYKGPDLISKISIGIKLASVLFVLIIIMISFIFKIHYYFIVSSVISLFAILYNYSLSVYIKRKR